MDQNNCFEKSAFYNKPPILKTKVLFSLPGKKLNWPNGCPLTVPCCNEYGYCRPEAEWLAGQFRDCNGLSNGINLPEVDI